MPTTRIQAGQVRSILAMFRVSSMNRTPVVSTIAGPIRQRMLQRAIAHDIAERIDAMIASTKTRAPKPAALRNVDGRDGRYGAWRRCNFAPHTEALEDKPGPVR